MLLLGCCYGNSHSLLLPLLIIVDKNPNTENSLDKSVDDGSKFTAANRIGQAQVFDTPPLNIRTERALDRS